VREEPANRFLAPDASVTLMASHAVDRTRARSYTASGSAVSGASSSAAIVRATVCMPSRLSETDWRLNPIVLVSCHVCLGIWKISHGVRRHPEVLLGRSADHRCAASNRTAVVHSPDRKRRAIFEVDLDRLARVSQRWQPHSRLTKRGIDNIPRIANKYISTISTVMQPPILEAIVCAG
jgi:hypothetical protein